MPISRSEFEKGEISPGLLIVEFLCSDPEQGYSLGELWEALGLRVAFSLDEFHGILKQLEKERLINSKQIGDTLYYICGKRLGFPTS